MKRYFFYVIIPVLLIRCNTSSEKLKYKNEEYILQDSEFGVSIFDNNALVYYIDDTVYKGKKECYCLITGWLDKGERWVVINNNEIKNIDSTKIDFKSCKKLYKGVLLKR